MFGRLGPVEIDCDSPSYVIVRACRRIGLRDPEDVRWCRLRHVQTPRFRWRDWFSLKGLKRLLGWSKPPQQQTCVCGEPLPPLTRYAFTYRNGVEESYLLGQCTRCRTIYWETP